MTDEPTVPAEPTAETGPVGLIALSQLQERLQASGLDATTEEVCEALWLFSQAPSLGGLPGPWAGAQPGALRAAAGRPRWKPGGERAEEPAKPTGPHQTAPRRPGNPVVPRPPVVITGEEADADADVPVSAIRVRVPDAPALPEARKLLLALRQFRYDQARTYDWDQRYPPTAAAPGQFRYPSGLHCTPDAIDEEGTAQLIAQTDIRLPVLRTTRRRTFDLDLVLDTGGSGLMWTRLAVELRSVLQASGAFRMVRPWTLGTDEQELPLHPGEVLAGHSGRLTYSWDRAGDSARKPLVMVLTDGTGVGWRTGAAGAMLRDWAARKHVVLVQLLPPEMWDRTALRAFPVLFRPDAEGYHRAGRLGVSDIDLALARVGRAELPGCAVFPVISLDAAGLASWLPLLHSAEKAQVPGYALIVPPDPVERATRARPADDRPPSEPPWGAEAPDQAAGSDSASAPIVQESLADQEAAEWLATGDDGRERVEQFMLCSSADARTLARQLGVIDPLTLPIIRRVRHKLLHDSSAYVLAEVLLGGLLHWTPTTIAASLAGQTPLYWCPGVQDVLQERPGGVRQLRWDQQLVLDALAADDAGPHSSAEVMVAVPDPAGALFDGSVPLVTSAAPVGLVPPLRPVLPLKAPRPLPASSAGRGPELDTVGSADITDIKETSPERPLQIGIWGSRASGRSVYLTSLCMLGMEEQWTRWKRELWRVVPGDQPTTRYVAGVRAKLEREGLFPDGNIPGHGQKLSFRIERLRPRARGVLGMFWRERSASITVRLEDWAGANYERGERRAPAATDYLLESDVLLYFYDPLYDDDKHRSFEYFDETVLDLSHAALESDRLYQGRLPQQLAVCIPKLDNQWVFDIARKHGCVEVEPATGLPWVPPRLARRLFEEITIEKGTIDADYLRREIGGTFHPKRTSYHAFSSIGFWTPDGRLDLTNLCNVDPDPSAPPGRPRTDSSPVHATDPNAGPAPAAGQASPPPTRLRGAINPVHVMDPIIALVQRASGRGGAQ